MSPHVLFRLLRQHIPWFIVIPGLAAGIVFYLTRNEPRVYKSQAMLYTGLSSGYSLVPGQQTYNDKSSVAFDNLLTTLNSTETQRQIGVSLLTAHLQLAKPDPLELATPGFDQLQQAIPVDWRLNLLNGQTTEQLRSAIDSLSQAKEDNPVKELMAQPTSYYSAQQISKKLKSTRKNTNDMLELEYDANDPAVAQKTLEYAIDILRKRYTALKTSGTSSVVGYYDDKSQQTKQRLEQAEKKLQSFSVENNVVDFEEDAKNVAESREQTIADYNEELMRNRAAKAAMDALRQRMGQRSTQLAAGDELKKKQDELTEAQNQLVNARAYNRGGTVATQQAKVDRIAEELKATASKFYAATNSSESVPQQALVADWSAKVTEYEESSARLKLFDNRLKETESKTAEFTPLSSKRRKLDRELSVAEKEYLASTENLNQARTQEGDATKSGAMSTLDKPSYPTSPLPSKRWLLIAASVGVGLFLTLFMVAIRFWLDQRVNSPEKAELVIGRPVAAMFPTVRKASGGSKASRAALNMFEQLCNAINIEIVQKTAKPHPPIITVFSVRSQQGKTWTINGLARLYADAGQQVAYFYPRFAAKSLMTEQNGITFIPYTVRPDFMNVLKLEHLLDEDDTFVAAHFDKVILELPSLVSTAIPVYLVDKSYVSVLVINAGSPWERTEKQLMEMYMRVATHPVLTVLNQVEGEYIDAFGQHEAGYAPKRSANLLANRRNLPTG